MKIAIIGMAFRLPGGVDDEDSFWRVLKEGRDVVSEIPEGRWGKGFHGHPDRQESGKSITWSAGVLDQSGGFDAAFFGISPREADNLDPQQRLLLELTWEALENGGQIPLRLAGSDCAVYLGISGTDYGLRSIDDLSSVDAYTMTGNTLSIAANRISYAFDLRGPSMAIDTACSSSMVALHQACKSLRHGESGMAVAAGINMLLHPYPFIGFTKASMLSANGRCRAFDAAGDGYVRAEGAGVLILKPLERALADGDPIHAVILASGVNSDGYKNSITIPSIQGQSALLRATCAQAGISPDDIVYVEAHGTGTAVGDPVETAAIGEALATRRSPASPPLSIGSVKTNLGHLETASGMAGVIKTVLCLKRRALPASLHLETPNPNIDFTGLNLRVVREYTPLAKTAAPLRMAVNSFGFGGANGNVVLEEYVPPRPAARLATTLMPPLVLSARSEDALRELAGRYARLIESGRAYYDVAYAAAHKRQWLTQRLAVSGENRETVLACLDAYAQGQTREGLMREDAPAEAGKLAFVYSGNGAQWLGMGRALLVEAREFRSALREVDALFQPMAGFSIVDALQAEEDASRLHLTSVAQPTLFAIQVGVTRMLRAQGLEADAVVGHSVGEVAAAWAAGALSLAQAVRVIHERSAAQETTRGSGKMAAVSLPEAEIRDEIERLGLDGVVEVAGINSLKAVTLSGPESSLAVLGQALEARAVFFRVLDLDYAFHSRAMDGLRSVLVSRLDDLISQPGDIGFYSTVTGDILPGNSLDAAYWWRNIREPVRFEAATRALIRDGVRLFVEIGPHAIMQRYLGECLAACDVAGRVLPSLKRDDDGPGRIRDVLNRALLLDGIRDLSRVFPHPGNPLELPAYPWQRECFWYKLTDEGYDLVNRERVHPLLGYRLKDADAAWENQLDPRVTTYLLDHVVGGAVVFPASGFVEMALAASRAWFNCEHHEIEALEIRAPIVFDGEHARTVRFELSPADGGFEIKSRERLSGGDWRTNVVGRLLGEALAPRPEGDAALVIAQDWNVTDEQHYQLAARLGLDYGPDFRGVAAARVDAQGVRARLVVPPAVMDGFASHLLHPVLLDACFQSLFDGFREEILAGGNITLLPVSVGRMRCYAAAAEVSYCRSLLKKRAPRSAVADFTLLDEAGNVVATLEDCRFRGAVLTRHAARGPASWRYHAIAKPHPTRRCALDMPPNVELADVAYSSLAAPMAPPEARQRTDALFEALVAAFAWEAFQHLCELVGREGAPHAGPTGDHADDSHDLPSLPATWLDARIPADKPADKPLRALLDWLLGILAADGILRRDESGWSAGDSVALPAARDIWLALLGEDPTYLPDLLLAARVGAHLPELLDGRLDAEVLVRAVRASALNEQCHDTSPTHVGLNRGVRQVLAHLAASLPAHGRLRILDIGAGQGALARQLLPLLPRDRFDYCLAGLDESSVAHMEVEFGHHAGVTFMQLDSMESLEPLAGESVTGPFDVILLGHCLHRVADLHLVLGRMRERMAAHGLLLVLERAPDAMANLQFGLDTHWWRPGRAGGRASSLMRAEEWRALLETRGFEDVVEFGVDGADAGGQGVYGLLAKAPEYPIEAASPASESANWLLLADAEGDSAALADALAVHLRKRGQRVCLARMAGGGASERDDAPRLVDFSSEAVAILLDDAVARMGGCDHVVHMLGMLANDADLLAAQDARCITALHLAHAAVALPARPKLWLLARGGAVLTEDADIATFASDSAQAASWAGGRRCAIPPHGIFTSDPVQAALWGFGRVLMNEHPELACTLLDIQAMLDASTAARLCDELLAPDGEDEIILAEQGRYVTRMSPYAPPVAVGEGAHARLDFSMPGQLKNLHWVPLATRDLASDEIEIQPRAVGLNFRDVMYAMGLLSDEAVENGFAGATLGMELAGVVTRVGVEVDEFRVGDAVVAFAPASFASRVVTKAASAAYKPETWSFEEAATVPTVFFTVYYALHYLARLQPGEKVLIHGAAGGVGIAAMQVASYLGAEIFATAGSDEKRDFVAMLGADHVMNSRTLSYADEIMRLTDGQGIDVVLNSLAGEAINRNFRVLRPFGRFLELGKRDFYENTRIGLRPFKDNITYHGIDADQLMVERPALAASLFREVMALFAEGVLRPLPYRTFPADRVVEAFRYMQASRQIGKVVVTFEDAPPALASPAHPRAGWSLDPAGTYLVTGGIGGFGQRTARWLVERGARHLLLLSRRGPAAPGAAEARAELEGLGASVLIKSCDVTDAAQVHALVAEVATTLPALKGVVHAAMVLDDGLIRNLDRERFLRAMAPKIQGAWNLHNATLALPLDFFVLYSSATTFIGNPGQANYVAANMYLESLANYRRARGLPATCVAWGAIADVGYLTRHEDIKDALQSRLGGQALESSRALDRLGELLAAQASGVAVMDFDWHSLHRFLPATHAPRFDELRRMAGQGGVDSASGEDIRAMLMECSIEEAQTLIIELLLEEVAGILRLPKERIDTERSLYDLGMDSLMGVELVLGIEKRFGISLPVMALTEGPTIKRISERLVAALRHDEQVADQPAPDRIAEVVSTVAAQHGVLASAEDLAEAAQALREHTSVGAKT